MQQTHISQYDLKVLELLSKTHNRLNQKFPFIQESRQLSNQENQLLFQIDNESPHYKILVAAMAIDTYTQSISEIFDEADSLLEILSICLSCAQKMKNEMKNLQSSSQAQIAFQNLYNSLINMIESASIFNPNSPYLQIYRSVLSDQCQNLSQNIYSSLKQQNKQLKQRLRLNDEKIIQLQIKLTRILQQHEGQVGVIENTMKNYELKQQIQRKQRQIQRMNEEFCYEIEKYNVVYDTLKRELQEYKSYQNNVETVKLIEKLQTQIIVLREEKEREQMINEQLRHRLQIVSQANLGPIHSPRMTQKRRDVSRTQYVNDSYGHPLDQFYYERDSSMPYDTENDESDPQIRVSAESRYGPMINRGYSEYINHTNQYRY